MTDNIRVIASDFDGTILKDGEMCIRDRNYGKGNRIRGKGAGGADTVGDKP